MTLNIYLPSDYTASVGLSIFRIKVLNSPSLAENQAPIVALL